MCFLGEGLNGTCEHKEYKEIIEYVHKINLKAALYSGRNTVIEEWMKIFDYIKLGSYKEEQGPIYNKKTNQRLYKKQNKNIMISQIYFGIKKVNRQITVYMLYCKKEIRSKGLVQTLYSFVLAFFLNDCIKKDYLSSRTHM